jgi:branched-chain amino acid transport system ATP-binding protein
MIPAQEQTHLLSVDGLVAGYGRIPALHGVSLSLGAGGCVAVLGANGAGKSTLALTLAGFLAPMDGTIDFDGSDITGFPAHAIARMGLIRLPEHRGIFPNLTVDENLTLGTRRAPTKALRKEALDRIRAEFPVLAQRRRQLAGTLSGGEQQLLALGHVVAIPPRLLVADELSLGLAPVVLDRIYDLINRVKASGTAILLIEQFFDRALGIADRVILLRRGKVAMDARTTDLKGADYLREMLEGIE